jgi:hypothetical protein
MGIPQEGKSWNIGAKRRRAKESNRRSPRRLAYALPRREAVTDFYEDSDPDSILCENIPSYNATRAVKPIS